MNIFRLLGDLSHLLAIIILLLKIWKTKSCAGISGKSQILFVIVYTTRYLDLLTIYISVYNTTLKLVFIITTCATVYLIYFKFRATYDHNHDTFRIEFLLIPCLVLALLINQMFTFLEVMWTFSIYLESVAILPQLLLVLKTGKAESIILCYLIVLGSYRALYILNWVYRYVVESHYEIIAIVSGVVQTVLYCGFFCLYIIKGNATTASSGKTSAGPSEHQPTHCVPPLHTTHLSATNETEQPCTTTSPTEDRTIEAPECSSAVNMDYNAAENNGQEATTQQNHAHHVVMNP